MADPTGPRKGGAAAAPAPYAAAAAGYPPQVQPQYAAQQPYVAGYAQPPAGAYNASPPAGRYPQQYAYPPPQPAYAYAQQPVYASGPQVVVQMPKPSHAEVQAAASAQSYSEQMDKAVRMGFIRKVFGVLSVQLLVTFGIVALFTFSDTIRTAVQSNPAILFIAIGVTFITIIALACCPGVARSYPGNYICLGVFTLAEGYLVGAIASFYSTDSVILAVGGTVIITAGLMLFAWQTKIDFTAMSSGLFVVLLCFILFGLVVAIDHSRIMRTVYAAIGLLIFSLFLVYDVQLTIGGKGRDMQYSPDDYIFAALNIYIDIIQIFLFLLRLFGSSRD